MEKFLTTPTSQPPVIKILLAAANTQRAIAATATAQKSASAELDLPVIDSFHGWSDHVPIGFGVEVIRPAILLLAYTFMRGWGKKTNPPTMWTFSRSLLC